MHAAAPPTLLLCSVGLASILGKGWRFGGFDRKRYIADPHCASLLPDRPTGQRKRNTIGRINLGANVLISGIIIGL